MAVIENLRREIESIRTEYDYDLSLARISDLMDALTYPDGRQEEDPNHPDRVELDTLVDLVEEYEDKRHPINPAFDPVGTIEFVMDQTGLTERDLIPFIGSREKVAEVMSGKRAVTTSMARSLEERLGIPADLLVQKTASSAGDSTDD